VGLRKLWSIFSWAP